MSWTKSVLADMRVEINIPVRVYKRWGTPEYWKELEQKIEWEIRDLQDFIRDHRSRDSYDIYINRIYDTVCVHCGYSYGEVGDADIVPVCCDAAMKESGYMVVDYNPEQESYHIPSVE